MMQIRLEALNTLLHHDDDHSQSEEFKIKIHIHMHHVNMYMHTLSVISALKEIVVNKLPCVVSALTTLLWIDPSK